MRVEWHQEEASADHKIGGKLQASCEISSRRGKAENQLNCHLKRVSFYIFGPHSNIFAVFASLDETGCKNVKVALAPSLSIVMSLFLSRREPSQSPLSTWAQLQDLEKYLGVIPLEPPSTLQSTPCRVP
jgi:hypothetical protein